MWGPLSGANQNTTQQAAIVSVNYTGATINPSSAGNGVMDLQYDGVVTTIGNLTIKTTYGGSDYTVTSYSAVIHSDPTIVRVTLTGTVNTWQAGHGIKVSNDGSGNINSHTDTTTLTNNSTVNLLASLASFWKLADTADAVGSRTLTNNNGVTFAAAKIGNGADFEVDGAPNMYLSRARDSTIDPGDANFTISCWVKLESEPAVNSMLMGIQGTGFDYPYLLRRNNTADKFDFKMSNGSSADNGVAADSLGTISTGTWYCITAGHDTGADQLFIQVNGGTRDTTSRTITPTTSTTAFTMGSRAAGGTALDGLMDVACFASKVWTSAEHIDFYNSGNGKEFPFQPT